MKEIILFITVLFTFNITLLGQSSDELEIIESLLIKEVKNLNKKNKKGDQLISTETPINELTNWLLSLPQVEDAENNNCGLHTMQYPGYRKIGIKLYNDDGSKETVFLFQIGRTPIRRKKADQNVLIYINSKTDNNFISAQRKNCKDVYLATITPTKYDSLIGIWMDSTGLFGYEIAVSNPKYGQHGITKMSSLVLKIWRKKIDDSTPLFPFARGNDNSTTDYDFGQDTWMQKCGYFYKIIDFDSHSMVLQRTIKTGMTSSESCSKAGTVIHYELFKTNSNKK